MDSSSIDSLFFFAVLAPKNQDSNSTDMISHALQTFALHDDSFARLYFLPMSSKGFGLAPHCTPAYLMSDKPLEAPSCAQQYLRTRVFSNEEVQSFTKLLTSSKMQSKGNARGKLLPLGWVAEIFTLCRISWIWLYALIIENITL